MYFYIALLTCLSL